MSNKELRWYYRKWVEMHVMSIPFQRLEEYIFYIERLQELQGY